MDNLGYIKLFRKFLKWEWYKKSEMVHLFLHFLLLANHEDNHWQGQIIKKGQFITGRNSLYADTGISPQTIRTCISKLKSTNEITTKSTNKFTIITIVKWEEYQTKSTNKLTNKLTNDQPTTNQQLTTNKNTNNDKNIKNTTNETNSFSFNSNNKKSNFVPVDWNSPLNKPAKYFTFKGIKYRKVHANDHKKYAVPPNGKDYILYDELLNNK